MTKIHSVFNRSAAAAFLALQMAWISNAGAQQARCENPVLIQTGPASWYGPGFHNKKTSSGEKFNQNAPTAAHKKLPFGTKVKVINTENGQSTIVRINDRGPFKGRRIIDLSRSAAGDIDMQQTGVAPVKIFKCG